MKKIIKIYLYVFLSLTSSYIYSMQDMAIIMGAQQGASIANQAITKMFTSIGKSIMTEESNTQNSMKSFTTNIFAAQNKDAEFLAKVLSQALNLVGKQEGEQNQYFQKMQDYIIKMVSLYQPGFYYLLEGATLFDQAFAHGTMFTPKGPLWKNIFAKGNWEYDQDSDSFWQLARVPTLSQDDDQNNTTETSKPLRATYNSIFTEYIAHAKSYEIQCEITLYNIEFPFFVGIMFNKTRWISGNADSLTKCRLLGISGYTQDDFGVYCAEQHNKKNPISFSKNTNSNKNESHSVQLYPLNQIINKSIKAQQVISSKLFANLHTYSPTFVIHIVTSPKTIKFKVWQKGTKPPADFITINSNNQDLYLYHDIGFMSPGAIAEFKLLKPTNLLFSKNAISEYAQEVSALIEPKVEQGIKKAR